MTDDEWLAAKASLIAECPLLFRRPDGERNFYFEIQPGWYKPVRELCLALEKVAEGLEAPTEEDAPDPRPRVVQIKEKFGGLRFYYYGWNDETTALVQATEAACWKICEACGEPGERRRDRWIQTLCDAHHKKEKE